MPTLRGRVCGGEEHFRINGTTGGVLPSISFSRVTDHFAGADAGLKITSNYHRHREKKTAQEYLQGQKERDANLLFVFFFHARHIMTRGSGGCRGLPTKSRNFDWSRRIASWRAKDKRIVMRNNTRNTRTLSRSDCNHRRSATRSGGRTGPGGDG